MTKETSPLRRGIDQQVDSFGPEGRGPQRLKPHYLSPFFGTTKVVPFPVAKVYTIYESALPVHDGFPLRAVNIDHCSIDKVRAVGG